MCIRDRDNPALKFVPKLTNLLPDVIVETPVNPVSTEPVNPDSSPFTTLPLTELSNWNILPSVLIPT